MRYYFFILAAVSCPLRIPTLSFTIQNALITSSTTVSSVSSLLLTATVILLFSCHSRIRQGSGHYDHRWVQEYARIPISKYTPRGSRYHRPAIMQTISGWDRWYGPITHLYVCGRRHVQSSRRWEAMVRVVLHLNAVSIITGCVGRYSKAQFRSANLHLLRGWQWKGKTGLNEVG